jgi:hypothetical protein
MAFTQLVIQAAVGLLTRAADDCTTFEIRRPLWFMSELPRQKKYRASFDKLVAKLKRKYDTWISTESVEFARTETDKYIKNNLRPSCKGNQKLTPKERERGAKERGKALASDTKVCAAEGACLFKLPARRLLRNAVLSECCTRYKPVCPFMQLLVARTCTKILRL